LTAGYTFRQSFIIVVHTFTNKKKLELPRKVVDPGVIPEYI